MRRKDIKTALSYHKPLSVTKVLVFKNKDSCPLCSRCNISIDHEYMRYCNRCGQSLNRKHFNKAQVVYRK